jgi:glucokinase
MILAGDIGGTNTRLAIGARDPAGRLRLSVQASYPSRDHAGLEEIVELFLSQHADRVVGASFGIAGPVRDGRCETTNLPWVVESKSLALLLGLPAVGLINDLEANAWGLAALEPDDLLVLNPGAPGAAGNSAIIAAGTGLGEAGLYWDGRRHRPFATEGGHADFAPGDEVQDGLLHWLRARHGRVSWERVLSGPGLVNIYTYLRELGGGHENEAVAAEMRRGDPAAAISTAAIQDRCPLSLAALDLFVTLYGAEAGNLALKTMATGGLFLGGGIAPRIAARLGTGRFMEAFVAKGRMQPLMESMPVRVVLNDGTALLGAARHAAGDWDAVTGERPGAAG